MVPEAGQAVQNELERCDLARMGSKGFRVSGGEPFGLCARAGSDAGSALSSSAPEVRTLPSIRTHAGDKVQLRLCSHLFPPDWRGV